MADVEYDTKGGGGRKRKTSAKDRKKRAKEIRKAKEEGRYDEATGYIFPF